jgi:beta-glucosidase/6-phospho-beta-glucosidase/beta-galactosidase
VRARNHDPTELLGWHDEIGGGPLIHDEDMASVGERIDFLVLIIENGSGFEDRVAPNGQVENLDRIRCLERHLAVVDDAVASGVDLWATY